jgi:glycosyltransferase involved in cell wall biosynthesis
VHVRKPVVAQNGSATTNHPDAHCQERSNITEDRFHIMRVLLSHNFYKTDAPSGENSVFRNERSLLEERGVEVITYERENDDILDSGIRNKLTLARNLAWSKTSYTAIADIVRKFRPDIAHFHNTFPLISPSAYQACWEHGVPVVQTLHNYRLICPSGLLFRDNHPCQECVGRLPIPSLIHRCYRHSLPATAALFWTISRNRLRGVYADRVDRYIAPTRFVADTMAAGGIPAKRIEIKPHFLPRAPSPGTGQGNYAVYVGRLGAEKGLRTLLSAWKQMHGYTLKIAGDGALRDSLQQQVQTERLDVEFLGALSLDDVFRLVCEADFLIMPTESYEVFGLAVIEAYACGTPVLAARIGGLAEIVIDGKTGATFESGNSNDLANKASLLRNNRDALSKLRRGARSYFDDNFTADKNFTMLMSIYERAISDRLSRRRS